jgi:hypothetical protein
LLARSQTFGAFLTHWRTLSRQADTAQRLRYVQAVLRRELLEARQTCSTNERCHRWIGIPGGRPKSLPRRDGLNGRKPSPMTISMQGKIALVTGVGLSVDGGMALT